MNTTINLHHIASINAVTDIVHQNAKDHGFHNFDEPEAGFIARTVSNMHAEISEFWEAFRNGTLHEPCDKAEKMKALGLPQLTCAEEELADVIIRALDTAERLKLDIGQAVAAKHAYNVTRSHRHGNKAA